MAALEQGVGRTWITSRNDPCVDGRYVFKALIRQHMISSAFQAAKFTYSHVGILRPIFASEKKEYTSPSDVEATITMIQTASDTWPDDDPLKILVDDALKKCVFMWDTIKLKKKKHNEKWFADWRSISLENEYKRLMEALAILEHRYTMAVLSKMSIHKEMNTK